MVTAVSQGEAVASLQSYLQVVMEILEAANSPSQHKDRVKMFDGDRQVYGADKDGNFHDEVSGHSGKFLNPELNEEFQKLAKATKDEVIPSAPNKRVEIDGDSVLATDTDGKVTIANLTKESQEMPSKTLSEELNNGHKEISDKEMPDKEKSDKEMPNKEMPNDKSSYSEEDNQPKPTPKPHKIVESPSYSEEDSQPKPTPQPHKIVESPSRFEENSQSKPTPKPHKIVKSPSRFEEDSQSKPIPKPHKIVEESPTRTSHSETPQIVEPKQERSNSGTVRVKTALNQLPDGELKHFLLAQQQQLQEQLQEQKEQMKLILETLQGQQKVTDNQTTEKAIATRVEEPKQTKWWQKVGTKIKEIASHVQQKQAEQQASSTLHELYQRQVRAGATECQMEGYKITQEGKTHTLSDRSGQSLLKWREGLMGTNVVPESCKLDTTHLTEINQLQKQLTKGEVPDGTFKAVNIGERGASDAQYLNRVTQVVSALTDYAKNQGGRAQVEGSFFYQWNATQSGQVQISAKDGRESLLSKSSDGTLKCKMTDKDLKYFEQMIPTLQQQQNVQKPPVSRSSKDSEISR